MNHHALTPLPVLNQREHLQANLKTPLSERVSFDERQRVTTRHNMWLGIHMEVEPLLAQKRFAECPR